MALARASTDEDKDAEADMDWVDADKDAAWQNMRPFSKSSVCPLTEILMNCCWFLYLCH